MANNRPSSQVFRSHLRRGLTELGEHTPAV